MWADSSDKVPLEIKDDAAEKTLFRCVQKPEESNDSFLARSNLAWSEFAIILAKEPGAKLEELQACTTLRGSQAEDTKCVLIKIGAENGGVLMIKCVTAAVGMLGASFFQDYTGEKKQKPKLKIYDHSAFIAK